MCSEKHTLKDIAATIGAGRGHVREYLREQGVTRSFLPDFRGDKNPKWRGGRMIDKDGYVWIHNKTHPHRKWGCYVLEHRFVMERHIGRLLLSTEVVHHKNRNKQDNRLSNLELFVSNALHLKHELVGKTPRWTESGKKRIQAGIARSLAVRAARIRNRKAPNAPQSQ